MLGEDIEYYLAGKFKKLKNEILDEIGNFLLSSFEENGLLESTFIGRASDYITFWVDYIPWLIEIESDYTVIMTPHYEVKDKQHYKWSPIDFRGMINRLNVHSRELIEELDDREQNEIINSLKKRKREIEIQRQNPGLKDSGFFEIKKYRDI